MNDDFVTFQISDKIYWGFRHYILRERLLDMSDQVRKTVIKEIKAHMKIFFADNNLLQLSDGVDKLNLCFHENILPQTRIIYICTHCHDENDHV